MQMLEGQKYVTASFVPLQVHMIYSHLKLMVQDQTKPQVVLRIGNLLLEDFMKRWNIGPDKPIFNKKPLVAKYKCQHGIYSAFIIVMCLDPCLIHFPEDHCGINQDEKE